MDPVQPVTEDDDRIITVRCNVGEANPVATVTWEKNDQPVSETGSSQQTGDNEGHRVTSWVDLTASRLANGDHYQCQVQGQPGLTRDSTIDIRFGPGDCLLKSPLSPWLPEGSEQTFECLCSSSNPRTLVSWLLVTEEGAVEQNLTESATISYSPGEYSGETTRSHLTLILTRGLNGKSVRYTAAKLWTDEHHFNVSYRHQVAIDVSNNNAVEGSNITLTCDAQRGNPPLVSTYYWSFSSKLSDFHPQFKCTSTMCQIHGVNHMYVGRYTCIASNGWGGEEEGKASADVEVLYSPVTDMQHITAKKSYATGVSISLPCHFFSYPNQPYIAWYQQPQGDTDEHKVDENQITTVRNGTDRYTSTVTLYDIKHNMTVTCRGEESTSVGHRTVSDGYQYHISVYEPEPDPLPTSKGVSTGVVVGCALATLAVGVGVGAGIMFYYQRRRTPGATNKGHQQDTQTESHHDSSPHYCNMENPASHQYEDVSQDAPVSASPHYDDANIYPQYKSNPHDASTPARVQHDTIDNISRLPHYDNLPDAASANGENQHESTHAREITTYQKLLNPGFGSDDNPPTYEELQLELVA